MNEMNGTLSDMLDLHGADLERWPDRDAAQRAREAALSDPAFRRQLESAKRLDRSMVALSDAIDTSAGMETRLAHMQAGILARVEPQAQRRRAFTTRSLMRLAASLILACGLGIGVGQIIPDPPASQPDALDQMLLGTDRQSVENGAG